MVSELGTGRSMLPWSLDNNYLLSTCSSRVGLHSQGAVNVLGSGVPLHLNNSLPNSTSSLQATYALPLRDLVSPSPLLPLLV